MIIKSFRSFINYDVLDERLLCSCLEGGSNRSLSVRRVKILHSFVETNGYLLIQKIRHLLLDNRSYIGTT